MTSRELYQAGKLDEAIQALGGEVRDNPTDARRRTFLFELLCFAGDWERAAKHLNILAGENKQTDLGAMLYRSALHADRQRHELFEKKEYPSGPLPEDNRGGTWTDAEGASHTFESIEDADPRIGARLEMFTAGAYMWMPFAHIERIEIQKPSRLRDLLWSQALVRSGPSFKGTELGEILLPVISPFSYKHPDGNVRLGRLTVWEPEGEDALPYGQRSFMIDGEDVPLLELRSVEFTPVEEEAA
ncbi:MAG: type VI secretion system accessory protein TagJ [Bryobacteraceae bacterium]